MQAFDTNLHTSFYAPPAFQKQFGYAITGEVGQYQLKPGWQSAICKLPLPIALPPTLRHWIARSQVGNLRISD